MQSKSQMRQGWEIVPLFRRRFFRLFRQKIDLLGKIWLFWESLQTNFVHKNGQFLECEGTPALFEFSVASGGHVAGGFGSAYAMATIT